MKTPQTTLVVQTRNRVEELLRLIPNKRFLDCTTGEKRRFFDLENARREHEDAVRVARQQKIISR